jgi:multiple RNA-binding domain-containing protein 1
LPSAKRKTPGETADESAVSKKKSKKDDAGTSSDPKLREFLKVIGKPRESALADASGAGDQGPTQAVPEVALPEGESDDEYEQIPSRREKQEKHKSGPPMRASVVKVRVPASAPPSEEEDQQGVHDNLEGGVVSGDAEKPESADQDHEDAPPATDDDWLRSRTNRLLDLMDPENMPPQPTGDTSNTEPPGDTDGHPEPEETHQGSPQEVADEEPSSKMDVDQPSKDGTVETIRRTSRLFVRNLSYGATEDDIRECFEKFGTIQEVRLFVSHSVLSHLPLCCKGSKWLL